MSTQFTLDNSAFNGTSNLSRLLPEELIREIDLKWNCSKFIEAFGAGDTSCYEPEKGYTDPEWYWRSETGCIWGIGWRNGWIRLRGRGSEPKSPGGAFYTGVTEEEAMEFIEFLKEEIDFHHTPKL